MQDDENTKEQLIDELIELRLRVAEFETAETRAIGSENALQRSEYGYRTLFERARDSIMIIGLEGDRRGQIVAANPVAAEMHGYNLEEILTLKISDLDTPESAEKLSERIDRILKGEWLKEEATHRRKDGSVFPIEISACVLELGNEKYALAIDRDITERKRAQEELRESEEKFAKVFRYAPVLITLSNVDDGTYLEVNDKFSEVSGFSRAEAIGKTSVDLGWISPEDRKRLIEELQAHGSVRGMDLKLLTKDKREIHIIYNGELIKTKNRQVLLSIAHDITERKRAEQELRKFKSISDRANYGCAMVDLRGFLTYVNEAFANMHGFSSPELIGKNLSVFHTDEQMEHVIRLIEKLHRDGEFEFQEVWHAKKDGTVFPTLMGAAVIKDDEGTPIFLSATAIDITDRKQAEQDRENLRSQLLQSQKMATMGTLAGGIAHDFNNMLAIILGFSDMLLADKNEGDPEYEELQKIVKTSRDAADLVQRIRIFGRRAEMVLVPLDLNHQVDEVTKLLASTLPKTIDIDIHLTKDPVIIKADASQITQMVMNLAVNANEAMPQGGRLSIQTENILLDNDYCRVHVGVKPGPHVMLTVSDTGRGIDKGLMERIFDPFYSSKARDYRKGTGLGLSVVQGIVQQHGGHITVESEISQGTFFRMYFPALEHEIVPEYVETKIPYSAGGTETILLVEDEQAVRELGVIILEKFGYTVLSVGDGQEALDVYEKEQGNISLVILDILMPRMDGKECLEQLLRINPTVKAIISSGVGQEDLIQDVVKLGAKGAVNKPYGMRQLLGMVREVLDGD
ncbi:MAG: PAS domain S-box protein [Desulfomonile sp.]